MKRRDLFSQLPWTGYALAFNASGLFAQDAGQWQKPDFDRIAPPRNRPHAIAHEPNMTLVELETDVFIAGGGLAGVCAALSAARHGARVVLVQDRSRLGGNSSSEVKMHVVGANSHKSRPGWREGGIIEELRLADAAGNPQRCWELWDLLLYDKVVSERNITLLLETAVYAAVKKNGKIDHVMARCDKSEHLYRVRAPLYVDATGDSRLGLEAGAEMRTGREARSEFNESLAPEKADEETLGSSILFTSRDYGKPMPFDPPKWARKVTKEQLKFRRITSWEYGYWWIEWGGNLNTIWDNERIRFELLSITMGIWDYIKNSGEHPTSANWAMDWVGMMPGKRGSRRLMGDHLLTEHDLLRGTFPDGVAIGGWPMDDHPPGGFDRPDLPPNTVLRTQEVYNIPLRALYSRNVSNLMMAGRNISATHAAFTSTRVMATCAVIG
ncbi:MAG: FAD-dependent oxidoreductase, partial [Bryobacteraceae bacterium]|nr:FAD-dependent oxidoreductase [Bryobacteraceae bacterium]